jgi:hypothetical protein
MMPLFNTDGSSTCPLGLPMNQNRLAVPMWSYAMEAYPPARIVELGSYGGGFTTAIGVHAWRIGAQVVSYDVMQAPDERFKALADFLGIRFVQGDVFADPGRSGIVELIRAPGVTYLLCDNGDKRREFEAFAPHLKPGDVIAAHDYCAGEQWWPWSEIRREDVQDSVEQGGLHPFLQEHFDLAGWLAFRKS